MSYDAVLFIDTGWVGVEGGQAIAEALGGSLLDPVRGSWPVDSIDIKGQVWVDEVIPGDDLEL